MAIQMRRGQAADFNPSKLVPGEWAVSQDNQKIYMCFNSGRVVEVGTAISGFGYIRYSEYADGTNFVSVPTTTTKYIGFYMGSSTVAPTDKEDYTWSKFMGDKGDTGVGIESIEKTSTVGLVDTYTITYTDETTQNYTVTNGENNTIYWSTVMTNTTSTPQIYSNSGITAAIIGDVNLNPDSWNVYECTTGGAASVAQWLYKGNIKGESGTGTGDMLSSEYVGSGATKSVHKADTLGTNVGDIDDLNANDFSVSSGTLSVHKWFSSGGTPVDVSVAVDGTTATFTGLSPTKAYDPFIESAPGYAAPRIKNISVTSNGTSNTMVVTLTTVTSSQAPVTVRLEEL